MYKKIKSLVLHIMFDVCLWFGIYQLATGGIYAGYALNLIGFYAAFAAIMMFMMCVAKDVPELRESIMGNDNKVHNTYSYITTALEVAVFAALGHFLIATAFTFSLLISMGLKSGWRKELENV